MAINKTISHLILKSTYEESCQFKISILSFYFLIINILLNHVDLIRSQVWCFGGGNEMMKYHFIKKIKKGRCLIQNED